MYTIMFSQCTQIFKKCTQSCIFNVYNHVYSMDIFLPKLMAA